MAKFLSTPSARRATCSGYKSCRWSAISIHALREEGDLCSVAACSISSNFYPRPPRGGRHPAWDVQRCADRISIHALREEGDPTPTRSPAAQRRFLSTPSARRATRVQVDRRAPRRISIHALREEGDAFHKLLRALAAVFLSTPSARRATSLVSASNVTFRFLSTPSARRATSARRKRSGREANFYPRPPRGGRRPIPGGPAAPGPISIHALREEGDTRMAP